jgi:predicted DNA-binding protein (MmcQ/YjbR family)
MIEILRNISMKLPLVREDIKWGSALCFSVSGKLFLIISIDEVPIGASFKVDEEIFEELSSKDGFRQAPYFAKMKWVKIDNIENLTESQWKEYIHNSYNLIKLKLPKKIQAEIDNHIKDL